MAVDDQDGYYAYKQHASVPFKWELRPGVPKHCPSPSPPLQPRSQPLLRNHTTRRVSLPDPPPLSPPSSKSFIYNALEKELRTRSTISAPRTNKSILSSRTRSERRQADSPPILTGPYVISSPEPLPAHSPIKLKPPPSKTFYYASFEQEPRTRSFLSAPRTRSFLSSPRTRSERHRPDSPPTLTWGPEVVELSCFPSTPVQRKRVVQKSSSKEKKKSSRRVESDFGFDFGLGYSSDLETLTRWSVSSRKSVSPFRYSSPNSSNGSMSSRETEWAVFSLF